MEINNLSQILHETQQILNKHFFLDQQILEIIRLNLTEGQYKENLDFLKAWCLEQCDTQFSKIVLENLEVANHIIEDHQQKIINAFKYKILGATNKFEQDFNFIKTLLGIAQFKQTTLRICIKIKNDRESFESVKKQIQEKLENKDKLVENDKEENETIKNLELSISNISQKNNKLDFTILNSVNNESAFSQNKYMIQNLKESIDRKIKKVFKKQVVKYLEKNKLVDKNNIKKAKKILSAYFDMDFESFLNLQKEISPNEKQQIQSVLDQIDYGGFKFNQMGKSLGQALQQLNESQNCLNRKSEISEKFQTKSFQLILGELKEVKQNFQILQNKIDQSSFDKAQKTRNFEIISNYKFLQKLQDREIKRENSLEKQNQKIFLFENKKEPINVFNLPSGTKIADNRQGQGIFSEQPYEKSPFKFESSLFVPKNQPSKNITFTRQQNQGIFGGQSYQGQIFGKQTNLFS